MEAVIYARYSPRRNAADCESIETQVELCRSHAEDLGWPVAGVYTDEAMSGAEEDRPGLWEAVDALGPDRVLLVYRRDRLARDVYLEEVIHRAVAQKGAKVHALHGQNGESPEDTMVRQVLAVFSEYERKVTAARTRIAMRRHQANGRKMSSKPPYGYRFEAERLVAVPEEQAALARMRELDAEGLGARAIARQLKAEGYRPRRHGWYHATVKAALGRELDKPLGIA